MHEYKNINKTELGHKGYKSKLFRGEHWSWSTTTVLPPKESSSNHPNGSNFKAIYKTRFCTFNLLRESDEMIKLYKWK